MRLVGMRPVVVHGGGPQISDLMARLGIETEFRDGLRVTDAETVDIVRMVLIGQVNPQLVAAINMHGPLRRRRVGRGRRPHPGGRARPRARLRRRRRVDQPDDPRAVCSTTSSSPSSPRSAPTTTGRPTTSTPTPWPARSPRRSTPRSWSTSPTSRDCAATSTTASTLIRQTTRGELDALIADGTIAGGMIPKVESCVQAVRNGVRRAHILDGRVPHVLLLELFTDAGIGTMVTRTGAAMTIDAQQLRWGSTRARSCRCSPGPR